ncbi:unnamed protein product [Pleuronectes platessa]|uniref:Uncharacterized protein n=1 Tax=Pleuronectes platessa TaxID=8262 RepID=A0A9N7TTL1_PLEPL|nr:unnamed protein product [Pleuronectes platessa]
MDFVGLVTTPSSKPSQGGAFSHREEPVAWSAQAEGGTGGVEGFGGGEGKAHLLYSWPLCVKQALWAVTELERRASERPLALPDFLLLLSASLSPPPLPTISAFSLPSTQMFI